MFERLQGDVDTDVVVVLFVIKGGHGVKGHAGHFFLSEKLLFFVLCESSAFFSPPPPKSD